MTPHALGSGLCCHDLTVCYRQRPAVHHLSADLPMGTFTAVIGPNGAGKSTFLHALLGWLPLAGGRVLLGGEEVGRCRQRLTFLPQRRAHDQDFPIDVETVVQLGRAQHRGNLAGFTADDVAAVEDAMAEMGLERLRHRPLGELSGGQQQRALLARALATGADVVLLDEPLTGLDAPSTRELMERLRAWADRGRLILAVLHDLDAARRWCSHALLLNRHHIACGPVAEAMSEANLARTFDHG